jgi:para-nitrobenzyl esterase
VPIIIGNNTQETLVWADTAGKVTDEASYGAAIDKVFGAAARDRILKLYPASTYASPRMAFAQVTTDAEFTCQSRRVARTLSKAQKEPVYRYLFNHVMENDPEVKALGATHTGEHPFLFAWHGTYRPTDADRSVQRQIVGYWTGMAKIDNPNGVGSTEWAPASPQGDNYLEIGTASVARTGDANAHCDFWDTTPMVWPHI